jgi:hypothetical protein
MSVTRSVHLACAGAQKTTADPIVNDPKADTIPVADQTDVERVVGAVGGAGSVYFVAI